MIDFTKLFRQNIDNLFAYGSKFTADREMIKDCIQDVFVKLYSKRETLESVGCIESYLFVSLHNRIGDEFRKMKKVCDAEINDSCLAAVSEMEEYQRERQQRTSSLLASVEKHIGKLSPRQREIIRLYYVEQYKYDEICQIMGINYQSVRNLMHRSIVRLRECMDAPAVAV